MHWMNFVFQIVSKLCTGLQIDNGRNNKFALFEVKGNAARVIDDRTALVDILGKFEMLVLMHSIQKKHPDIHNEILVQRAIVLTAVSIILYYMQPECSKQQ